MDTIFAPATARGKAGVAVIRISGSAVAAAASALGTALPPARRASLRILRADDGAVLDRALVLHFPGPGSFTGEDVVEFHLHGSPAVQTAVLRVLGDVPGLRLAEPGEFTRRALENEQLDLAQVEGLGDLIEAETEAQRRQAQRVLSGALGERAASWRERLLRAAALLEASIDFSDEDVPEDVAPEAADLVAAVQRELATESAGLGVSERIRDGFEVAIIGVPNAGKSTLLNVLAGREAAITSSVAGTTRDVIEVRMDLGGLPVTVLDTAGLRDTEDVVERIGVDRARDRAAGADLRVFLDDPHMRADFRLEKQDIVVSPKADLGARGAGLPVSARTGAGIDGLVARITETLERRAAGAATITRERHRRAIVSAAEALDAAEGLLSEHEGPELAAEELRRAIRALDSLVGRVDVEDILDEIFSRFCLGK